MCPLAVQRVHALHHDIFGVAYKRSHAAPKSFELAYKRDLLACWLVAACQAVVLASGGNKQLAATCS